MALSRFWDTCGHLREGRERLEAVLAWVSPDLPASLRSRVVFQAGWMAYAAGDHPAACDYYQRVLRISREQGDRKGAAGVLNMLALTTMEAGDLSAARALYEEALGIYQEIGDAELPTSLPANLGSLALLQ